MKAKNNNGFVAADMTIAIIAIIIFSGLIISMMYNNFLENMKIKKEALAMIYLTEALENIGIADYNEVTQENAESLIPTELADTSYQMQIEVISDLDLSDTEDIIKKVKATISYKIGNRNYETSLERIKIKE